MDSDPDPKQKMHLIKNHPKIIKNKQFDNYDNKKRKSNIFFKKYAPKCHEKAFFIVGIVKERIFIVGSETGSVTYY
jgi:uncharacterized FlgJ-related protein